MEDLPADALDVYVPDDLVVEEERMVEEEREGYAEAVSLTLSQEEHTRKSYDSIKNCSQAHELIKLVRELPPSRVASSKSLTTNRIIKAVNAESIAPLKDLKSKILQGLGLDPNDKIPLVTELEKLGKLDCALKALGETSNNEAVFKMRRAAIEGLKPACT